MTRQPSPRSNCAAWLMAFLLLIPVNFVAPTLCRCLASESESSTPLQEIEEESEEARLESTGWELIDPSVGPSFLRVPRATIAACRGQNRNSPALSPALLACGTILRC